MLLLLFVVKIITHLFLQITQIFYRRALPIPGQYQQIIQTLLAKLQQVRVKIVFRKRLLIQPMLQKILNTPLRQHLQVVRVLHLKLHLQLILSRLCQTSRQPFVVENHLPFLQPMIRQIH